MSEHAMNAEMAGSPKDRAVAYLAMRQGREVGKLSKAEKRIKTPLMPDIPRVERTGPLVDTVTAYEKLVDALGDKGYEGAQRKLADMRPLAYDAAQIAQKGARITDALLTISFAVPQLWRNAGFGRRLLGAGATWYFRPLEWVGGKSALIGSKVASSEMVAPVVNAILKGGERVRPGQDAVQTEQVMHAQADASKQ